LVVFLEAIGWRPNLTISVIADIHTTRDDALASINASSTLEDLRAVESAVFGKRGRFAALKTSLKSLTTVDDKREAGQELNAATDLARTALEDRRRQLAAERRSDALHAERLDLTEALGRPGRGHSHVVTQAWQDLEDLFIAMGYRVVEGPEVETDWYNFEALNMGPGHPARGEFDTLFTDHVAPGGSPGHTLLRTHTSPVQIRAMQQMEPPIYVVAPGRVFRRDTPDATHMPVFHQIEGLVIDKGITMAHLAGTIDAFTRAFFGEDVASRLRPSYFPFTEPSAEFDIQRPSGEWLELGGCGMVHPSVLRAGGIDPEEWTGFAFGFGIDRMAVMRHRITDLREMYTNDLRFIEQF
jgi:phenylalanyl-tRNA synthetase alpha chain